MYYKPPSLLNDGLIFREDFLNPQTAAANGLITTGTPIKSGYAKVTSGNTILVPKLISNNFKITIIIVDCECYAPGTSGQSYLELLRVQTSSGARLIFGWQNSDGTLYASDNTTSVFSTPITIGRKLIAMTSSGSNINFYNNGILIGDSAYIPASRKTNTFVSIGSPVPIATLYYWTLPIYKLFIYNYAMSAIEIKQHYQLMRGLTA